MSILKGITLKEIKTLYKHYLKMSYAITLGLPRNKIEVDNIIKNNKRYVEFLYNNDLIRVVICIEFTLRGWKIAREVTRNNIRMTLGSSYLLSIIRSVEEGKEYEIGN